MPFTPVEWIAFLFVAIGLIKLIVIAFNKMAWFNFVSPLYKHGKRTSWIFLILSLLIFYYLLQELSIVQIMAAMAFFSFLIGFTFMQYSKDILSLGKKYTARNSQEP